MTDNLPTGSGVQATVPTTWTVLELIRWSTSYLDEKGVPQARLDSEYMLAETLGVDRLALYLQFDRPLDPAELAGFKGRLLRRAKREPLQHILGTTSFRKLMLTTDSRGLIPRPETEELVGLVLDWAGRAENVAGRVLDLGTGTGAIALSLLVEGDFSEVVATDVSEEALSLARENAGRLSQDLDVRPRLDQLDFRLGSLFDALRSEEAFDIVVSNPPYVGTQEADTLEPEVRDWEPSEALFAGSEGLDVIANIVRLAPSYVRIGGLLALEVGATQTDCVAEMLEQSGAFGMITMRRDLARRPRFVLGERIES